MLTRIESGMETAMMMVLFQLPRKSKNHEGGKNRSNERFAKHALNRSAHEDATDRRTG